MPAKPAPPRKSRAGRPPVVENDPRRDEIFARLMAPDRNLSGIQAEFGLSETALDTFRRKFITPGMEAWREQQSLVPVVATMQVDVIARVSNLIAKLEKMVAAVDAWLEDPKTPGTYNLNPRTHEVEIVYEEPQPEGPPRKRTEKLAKLMEDVERGLGISIVKGETRIADPRKLLIEVATGLKPILELYGQNTGQIRKDPGTQVNLMFQSNEWHVTMSRYLDVVRECPRCFEATMVEMEKMGGE